MSQQNKDTKARQLFTEFYEKTDTKGGAADRFLRKFEARKITTRGREHTYLLDDRSRVIVYPPQMETTMRNMEVVESTAMLVYSSWDYYEERYDLEDIKRLYDIALKHNGEIVTASAHEQYTDRLAIFEDGSGIAVQGDGGFRIMNSIEHSGAYVKVLPVCRDSGTGIFMPEIETEALWFSYLSWRKFESTFVATLDKRWQDAGYCIVREVASDGEKQLYATSRISNMPERLRYMASVEDGENGFSHVIIACANNGQKKIFASGKVEFCVGIALAVSALPDATLHYYFQEGLTVQKLMSLKAQHEKDS